MNINNFSQIKRTIQAENNYKDFLKYSSAYMGLGNNDKMITNLSEMKDKLNQLIEVGKLKTEDMHYQLLDSIVNGAMKIQIKPDKSFDDISKFYTSYDNFNDIYKSISGDD